MQQQLQRLQLFASVCVCVYAKHNNKEYILSLSMNQLRFLWVVLISIYNSVDSVPYLILFAKIITHKCSCT